MRGCQYPLTISKLFLDIGVGVGSTCCPENRIRQHNHGVITLVLEEKHVQTREPCYVSGLGCDTRAEKIKDMSDPQKWLL